MMRITALLVASCLFPASGQAQDAPTSPPRATQHVVVKVEGSNATFKRSGWTRFTALRFGTVLQTGDLINLPVTTSVTIVCDGYALSASIGGPGPKAVPCPATEPPSPYEWGGSTLLPTAHIDLPSPHRSLGYGLPAVTMARTPMFYWPSIAGAETYMVEILGPEFEWRGSTSARDPAGTVMWAHELPPELKDGKEYSISVRPYAKGKFIDLPRINDMLVNQHFTVARPVDHSALEAVPAELATLGLPAPVTTYLQARVLASSGSYDAAILLLTSLQTTLNVPARGRALGDIYAAKGSLSDAEAALLAAAADFARDGDVYGLALINEALADVLQKTTRAAEATARLRAALATFQSLGDDLDAARIRLRLSVQELRRP